MSSVSSKGRRAGKQTSNGMSASATTLVYEVDLTGNLPSTIAPDQLHRFMIALVPRLESIGYADIVIGAADLLPCIEISLSTEATDAQTAVDGALDDVQRILEELGCQLVKKMDWLSAHQLVGPTAAHA